MTLRSFVYPAVLLLSTASFAPVAMSQATPNSPLSAPQQSPYGGVTVEEIIARVNDQIITRSDYERAQQQLEAEARQQGVMPQDLENRKKNLLRDLIDQQLLLSKGKELGINGETELIKRLDEIRKQYHLDTLEDLEKAAKDQSVSFEDFKAKIRNDIITQQVVREEVGRRLQVTPGEVQRFFAAHQAEFSRPETVRLSEILISTGKPAPSATEKGESSEVDPQQLATAKAKADDIEAKLKAGQAFETLARSYSNGTTAAQGGELGNWRRGMLAKELEDKTFGLKVGEFTEPIRTKQGYIILKVTGHIQGGTPEFKDVQQEVEETLYMQRMQPALRQFLTTLREQAFLDLKPGYIDSGASPNQTKPVFSAYVPPAPKKKKKVQRVRFREKTHTVKAPKEVQSAPALPSPSAPAAAPASATAAATTDSQTVGESSSTAVPTAQKPAPAAAPAKAKTAKSSSDVASSGTMKPGKKEKIRFGQAPRETLPKGLTKKEDAGAVQAADNTPAANAEEEPANPLEATAEPKKKSRFSARAKLPKEKKQKGPKEDPFAPPPPDAEDVAARQTQAAPLGLNGDTSTKQKPKKQKAETNGQKVRYSDTNKNKKAAQPDQQQQPQTAPAADQAPSTQPAETPQPQK